MHVLVGTVLALFCFYLRTASASNDTLPKVSVKATCQALAEQLPHLVAFPGSAQYESDIFHFYASSQQNSTCTVEPHTPQDVKSILQLIARDRVPFAVKGGGHAYDIGQSSTTGIQISLSQFTQVTYHSNNHTVTVGAGLPWDKVYAQLEPLGLTIAGGRIPGIGVTGLSLGGGYSWKTNQVGLTIDTIVAHDVVLPTGEIEHVTATSNPDLFFALKGGLNNFGIVTSITYEALPQGEIFGGSLLFTDNATDLVHNATASFDSNNKDPKAQLLTTYASVGGQFVSSISLYYDGPVAPRGVFNEFLSIPGAVTNDVKTRKFTEFLSTTFGNGSVGIGPIMNVAQHVIPIVKYTLPILKQMEASVKTAAAQLAAEFPHSPVFVVTISPEPFINPNAHDKGGAYPHPASRPVTPASPFIAYVPTPVDPPNQLAAVTASLKNMCQAVQETAIQQGQSRANDILYPNYALSDTPLELLYGDNLPRLRAIAKRIDPQGVMNLTGGFKL